MHGARKVRAAPCGQRMSAFVHFGELTAAPSSRNGVPQRAWRAAQTRRSRRGNSRAAGACLQPQQDGGHELEGSLERSCAA